MTALIDIVSVYHRDENYALALDLAEQIERYEDLIPWHFIGVDNRQINRGFAKGCNLGASQGKAPVIGFLNPDVEVQGPFMAKVLDALSGASGTVITGERFGKRAGEFERIWGCKDWVCGAALFVRRDFFESFHGFDEQFVWGWEETDLIRRAQAHMPNRRSTRSISLPLKHESPSDNRPEDVAYKIKWFNKGAARFQQKWGRSVR